ncbi:MAG: histidine kinase dimerization/phospho-acceptor domain-containing protein [Gaiellaceae bacterium]
MSSDGEGEQATLAELISDLAHELRTPISAIAGFAELLRVRDDERLRLEAADQILAGTARLSRFVDELVATLEADGELALRLTNARARTLRKESQ